MSSEMVVNNDEAYELLAHLVASAEICTFEPCYYGPFRLLDAASRLMEYMLRHDQTGDTAWLQEFKQEIDQKKTWMMYDRPGYFQFLNEVTGTIAKELRHREMADESSTQPA